MSIEKSRHALSFLPGAPPVDEVRLSGSRGERVMIWTGVAAWIAPLIIFVLVTALA